MVRLDEEDTGSLRETLGPVKDPIPAFPKMVPATLVGVAALAYHVPPLRASRADPMVAMHNEWSGAVERATTGRVGPHPREPPFQKRPVGGISMSNPRFTMLHVCLSVYLAALLGCGDSTGLDDNTEAILFGSTMRGLQDVYVVPLTGGELKNITDDGVSQGGEWSPDGMRIAFTSRRDVLDGFAAGQVFVMDAKGGNVRNLSSDDDLGDLSVSWSPDGSLIAFRRLGQLYLMGADGANPRPLASQFAGAGPPIWSPDGSQVAFVYNNSSGDDIYVVGVGGGDPVNLTNSHGVDKDPAWSPDGSRIAFMSRRTGSDIYVMNPDGSDVTRLTTHPLADEAPTWSPNSDRIAFLSARDGNKEVYVMNADGTDLRNVSQSPDRDIEPAWSPDGSRIAYTSERGGTLAIVIANLDGTEVRVIELPGHNFFSPRWRPR
ncbi:MAG: PD40 domain-containing protein [Gemmatimonadetes bacterium]|nr:PD40 domain-containing protein [Gemmatimonadota bacterium]